MHFDCQQYVELNSGLNLFSNGDYMNKNDIDCSIIIPVYYNEFNIEPTFNTLQKEVLQKNKDIRYEIIFIDDGSGDNSISKLLEMRDKDPDLIKIIKLTKNFGQLAAMIAGYKYCYGKCAIVIDADLQDPPELINQMQHSFFNEGYEIVIGTRAKRKESLYRRITSRMAYSIIRKFTKVDMPDNGFNCSLMSRKIIEIILTNLEANPFFGGDILSTGYKVKHIPYTRQKREIGKSRLVFGKKIKIVLDSILAFSYLPIRIMSVAGIIISFLGFIYAGMIIYSRLFGGDYPFKGWAPIMVLILVLSGFQMLMLGVIGEYLWRTWDQVRNKPRYIIEKIYD